MLIELFDFLDHKTAYLILHVFGAILGAGGAFASDTMFFSTIKDKQVTNEELRFMKLGSRLVWAGLGLLVISGIFLVSTNPERYLSSAKFLAKLSIVGVIIVNGVVFHMLHLPRIGKHLNERLNESAEFMKGSALLLASGAVSMVSWIWTVALGVLKHVPYSYGDIMSVYLGAVLLGVASAVAMKRVIL